MSAPIKRLILFNIILLLIYFSKIDLYSQSDSLLIQYGTTFTDSISVNSEIKEYHFNGQAGDRIFLRMRAFGNNAFDSELKLYGPSDTLLANVWDGAYWPRWSRIEPARIDDFILPENGTYKIYCSERYNDETGNYRLSLESRGNIKGNATEITYDILVEDSIKIYDEIHALKFTGKAGDRIILRSKPSDNYNFDIMIELYGPSDTLLIRDLDRSPGGGYLRRAQQVNIEDFVLPDDGIYTIYISEVQGDQLSNYWLSLQCRELLIENALPINYDFYIDSTLSYKGKLHAFKFSGQAGERIILRMKSYGNFYFKSKLEILSPSDTLLPIENPDDSYTQIKDHVLPESGIYTIFAGEIDGDQAGDYRLSLQCREHLKNNALEINYDFVIDSTISKKGGMNAFKFEGQAGERIILRMEADYKFFASQLELFDPADTLLTSDNTLSTGKRLTQVTFGDFVLPETGTYTIYASELNGDETSDYWLSLQCREHLSVNAKVIEYDTLLDTIIAEKGQMHAFKFVGQTGERIILKMRSHGGYNAFDVKWEIHDQSDSPLINSDMGFRQFIHGGDQVDIVDYILPQNGIYTVYTSEKNGDEISKYWLSLQCREHLKINAPQVGYDLFIDSTFAIRGEIHAFNFAGKTGEKIILRMKSYGNIHFDGHIDLFGPSGDSLASDWDQIPGTRVDQSDIENYILPEDGLYTIYAREHYGFPISDYWLSFKNLNRIRENAQQIEYDFYVDSTLTPQGKIHAFQFNGNTGERIILRMKSSGNINFLSKIELYGPSGDSLAGDSGTIRHVVDIVDYILPEEGNYTILVSEIDGDEISDYWFSLQSPKKIELEKTLSNQNFTTSLNHNYYQVVADKAGILTFVVNKESSWNSELSIKKNSLNFSRGFFTVNSNDNNIISIAVEPQDTIFARVESSTEDEYSILATQDINYATNLLAIDNEVMQCYVEIPGSVVKNLIYKKGSNTQLLFTNLFDMGSDPDIGKFLDKNWSVKNAEVFENYLNLSLKHPSGFENNMTYSWTEDNTEIRCDINAPEPVILVNSLIPGGVGQHVHDHWAFPVIEGLQTGSYPNAYPDDQSWGIPSEGWISLWDDQVDEVYGYTFSGGYNARLKDKQEFLVPAGNSRISFHVTSPKPETPYEAIRDLANGPFLALSNSPDKFFVASGNEVTYTISFRNTGNGDATNLVIENELPLSLKVKQSLIAGGGIYDSLSNKIIWSKDVLESHSQLNTISFTAEVEEGLANETEIISNARIWCDEQLVATTVTSVIKVANPEINSISPNRGGNTGTIKINILGNNLDPNAGVFLKKSGEEDIEAYLVSGKDNGTELIATFDLLNKNLGDWNLFVINPSGNSVELTNGFSIERTIEDIKVDITGRNTIRVGRTSEYQITVENLGNVSKERLLIRVFTEGALLNSDITSALEYEIPISENDTLDFVMLDLQSLSTLSLPIDVRSIEGFDKVKVRCMCFVPPSPLIEGLEKNNKTTFTLNRPLKGIPVDTAMIQPTDDMDGAFIIYSGSKTHSGILIKTEDGWVFGENHPKYGPSGYKFNSWTSLLERIKERRLTAYYVKIPLNSDQKIKLKRWMTTEADSSRGEYNIYFWNCTHATIEAYRDGAGIKEFPEIDCLTLPAYIYKWLTGELPRKLIPKSSVAYKLTCKYGFRFESKLLVSYAELSPNIVTSWDPNEKVGPTGYSTNIENDSLVTNFITNNSMNYKIFFENLEAATAAAQEVLITDQLDTTLSWSTFSFDKIQIGEKNISAPGNSKSFSTTVDLRPDFQTIVEVECEFDETTGIVSVLLKGVDPYTGDYADMLPPNTDEVAPKGEGWFSFSIEPKDNLQTGTVIRNKAIIDFEVDIPPAPLVTNEVFNTIDADLPESNVISTTQFPDSSFFEVNWSGSDVGSGIVNYSIYVSKDNEPFSAWLRNTADTSANFEPQAGNHNYRFYSIAHDGAGNVETLPDSFDVQIDVVSGVEQTDELPKTFSLHQNYPNPFNPSTTIEFDVPQYSLVTMKIYDILGREIYTIVNEELKPGKYREVWNGINNFGRHVASGMYLIRMNTGKFVKVRKMLLIR